MTDQYENEAEDTPAIRIHHATAKKAEAASILLTIVDDENGDPWCRAFWPERGTEIFHVESPAALAAMIEAQCYINANPGRNISTQWNEDDGIYEVAITDEQGSLAIGMDVKDAIVEAAKVDAGEAQRPGAEEDGDGDGDEDEPEAAGSVVSDVFKQRYKERGRKADCGDWLALTLEQYCRVMDTESGREVTDLDRFITIATANGVDGERYLNTTHNRGWQGRVRMTVRMILAKRVADKGFLFVPEGNGTKSDVEIKAPSAWAKANATKPKAPATKKPKAS